MSFYSTGMSTDLRGAGRTVTVMLHT